MAKTIKFNLICDGKPIRTLEDLRDNFSVEDVLSYFQNGLLKRWLRVRGFLNELKDVNAITSKDDIEIISELVKIFGITSDITDIEKDTFIFKYTKNHQAWLRKYKEVENNHNLIIRHYLDGYEACIDKILDNKDNMPLIKATLNEIAEKYYDLFYMSSFVTMPLFGIKAPMAYYAVFMCEKLRQMFKFNNSDEDTFLLRVKSSKPENNLSLKEFDSWIKPNTSDFEETREILGDNLKVFAGKTQGYWKDIEVKGKYCMILSIEDGNLVTSAESPGIIGEELGFEEVNNKYPILNGIRYKSNSDTDKLLYLEV